MSIHGKDEYFNTSQPRLLKADQNNSNSYQKKIKLLEAYAKKSLKKNGNLAGLYSEEIKLGEFDQTLNKAYVITNGADANDKKTFRYVGVLNFNPKRSQKLQFVNEFTHQSNNIDSNSDTLYIEVPTQAMINFTGPINSTIYSNILDNLFNKSSSPYKAQTKDKIRNLLDPRSTEQVYLGPQEKLNTSFRNKLVILNKKEDLVKRLFSILYTLKNDPDIKKDLDMFNRVKKSTKEYAEQERNSTWNKVSSENTNEPNEGSEAAIYKQIVLDKLITYTSRSWSEDEELKKHVNFIIKQYPTLRNDPDIKSVYESKFPTASYTNVSKQGGKRKTRKHKNRKSKTRKH